MSNVFDHTTVTAGRNHEKHDSLTGFRVLHGSGSAFVNT
jgi:hypothetical protein